MECIRKMLFVEALAVFSALAAAADDIAGVYLLYRVDPLRAAIVTIVPTLGLLLLAAGIIFSFVGIYLAFRSKTKAFREAHGYRRSVTLAVTILLVPFVCAGMLMAVSATANAMPRDLSWIASIIALVLLVLPFAAGFAAGAYFVRLSLRLRGLPEDSDGKPSFLALALLGLGGLWLVLGSLAFVFVIFSPVIIDWLLPPATYY